MLCFQQRLRSGSVGQEKKNVFHMHQCKAMALFHVRCQHACQNGFPWRQQTRISNITREMHWQRAAIGRETGPMCQIRPMLKHPRHGLHHAHIISNRAGYCKLPSYNSQWPHTVTGKKLLSDLELSFSSLPHVSRRCTPWRKRISSMDDGSSLVLLSSTTRPATEEAGLRLAVSDGVLDAGTVKPRFCHNKPPFGTR